MDSVSVIHWSHTYSHSMLYRNVLFVLLNVGIENCIDCIYSYIQKRIHDVICACIFTTLSITAISVANCKPIFNDRLLIIICYT